MKHELFWNEISRLLEVVVIERVALEEKFSVFFIFFIVQKCTGGGKAILDFKRFNKDIKKTRFRMETLASMMSSQGDN